MMLKSVFYDWVGLNTWLFSSLNNHGASIVDMPMVLLGQVANFRNFPIYLLLWWAIAWGLRKAGYRTRAETVRRAAWQFALAAALAIAFAAALKSGLDFPRPAVVFGVDAIRGLDTVDERFSLPSGHATFAALLSTVLWAVVSLRWRLGLLLLTLSVGFSRVWVGAHFPADVLAGYGCGVGSAWFAGWLLRLVGRDRSTGLALIGGTMVFGVDQMSKAEVVTHLGPAQSISVSPIFNVGYWFNTGAAFSFLHDAGGWQRPLFIVISLVVSTWLFGLIRSANAPSVAKLGYSLILGGAMGNLFDRIVRGAVVDWLDLHWAAWHWPAFNVADMAITLGVTSLLIAFLRDSSPKPASSPTQEA